MHAFVCLCARRLFPHKFQYGESGLGHAGIGQDAPPRRTIFLWSRNPAGQVMRLSRDRFIICDVLVASRSPMHSWKWLPLAEPYPLFNPLVSDSVVGNLISIGDFMTFSAGDLLGT
jgi:hypothetical protein